MLSVVFNRVQGEGLEWIPNDAERRQPLGRLYAWSLYIFQRVQARLEFLQQSGVTAADARNTPPRNVPGKTTPYGQQRFSEKKLFQNVF